MKETNSEKTRIAQAVLNILAVLLSLYSITYAFFGYDLLTGRSRHLMLALPICFLTKGILQEKKGQKIRTVGYILLGVLVAGAMLYIDINSTPLSRDRLGMYMQADYIAGLILIVAVLAATWLEYGAALTCVVGVFLVYLVLGEHLPQGIGHPPLSFKRMISTLGLYTEGIMGTALGAIVSTVGAVLVFAGFLEISGASKVFMDLTILLFGRFTGGAAKIAVVSSSLFGTISGSAAANVAGTGIITIPLMKKTGFEPHYAGAVEATASSGGQIMPPIMGAAAFIIAEMLSKPYFEVMKAAIIPAAVFYLSIFISVDLYSRRRGIKGVDQDPDLPALNELLLKSGYLLLPIVLLFLLVAVFNKSAQWASFVSTLAIVALSWLRRDTRITPRKMVDALVFSGKSIVPISVVCAAAGMIVGIFNATGLGITLSSYIVNMAGDSLLLLCLLAAISSLILGMGMPTVACYLLLAALVAPAMIEFGVLPIAAHMFVFYFGIISAITPPVALAAFVGGGIAKCSPMKVACTSCILALPVFLVPFVFVYQPALLMVGTPFEILQVCCTTLLGAFLCAIGTQGYMFSKLGMPLRVCAVACAGAMLIPETITDVIGLAGLMLVLAFGWIGAKKKSYQEG
ncbi:MAG: TRAP transporter fused permease subunit [Lachnospiraceae bacterium]|nr:TRAP transporter fused permease subunit [Lachnospiraceae bacterium]